MRRGLRRGEQARGRTMLRQPQSRLAVSPVSGGSGIAKPGNRSRVYVHGSTAPVEKKKKKPPEVKALKEVDKTRAKIEKMQRERDARRKAAAKYKKDRAKEEKENLKKGRPGDVDFQRKIKAYRKQLPSPRPYQEANEGVAGATTISVAVRVRPVNEGEKRKKHFSIITCCNPQVMLHECKLKVDGITKVLENHRYEFDHTFGARETTDTVYLSTALPLVQFVFQRNRNTGRRRTRHAIEGGRATVFAYGQTGSGKTYTMSGLQSMAANDMFAMKNMPEHRDLSLYVSFFEIYGGKAHDLLHKNTQLAIREDGNGEVQVVGLQERLAEEEEGLRKLIARGNKKRTTHKTSVHDVSSRSHAICNLVLRDARGREYGKLSLIDLAGSERGSETVNDKDKQRRIEGAEINKSLLALKECIRALDNASLHVPYRASKLTLVLKHSFQPGARTTIISCLSPTQATQNHALDTLRYVDRIKSKQARELAVTMDKQKEASSNGADRLAATDPGLRASPLRTSPLRGSPAQRAPSPKAAWMEAGDGGSDLDDNDWLGPDPTMLLGEDGEDEDGLGGDDEDAWMPRMPLAARPASPPSRYNGHGRAGMPTAQSAPVHPSRSPLVVANADEQEEVLSEPEEELERSVREQAEELDLHEGDDSMLSDIDISLGGGLDVTRSPQPRPAAAEVASREAEMQMGSMEDGSGVGQSKEMLELHNAVNALLEKEETLLNSHMMSIQENAELLSEEGQLLARVQGEDVVDYDIDAYAHRLGEILARKMAMCQLLQTQLREFRDSLAAEEQASRHLNAMAGGDDGGDE